MIGFYWVYCHRSFPETHFKWFWDKKMFLERMGFGGWNMTQGIVSVSALQGVNMLVNVFFGVLANAAMGVMTTVLNATGQFSNNLAAAFNPQIIKTYAKSDFETLHKLMFRYCKFIFLLCYVIAIPLVLNMDFILHLWLKEVPLYAVILCQIRLIEWNVCMVQHPFYAAIYASGKIRKFVIIDNTFIAAIFFILWFLFSKEFSIIAVPCIYLIVNSIRSTNMFFMAKNIVHISIRKLIKNVILPLSIVVIASIPLPIFLSFHLRGFSLLMASTISFFCVLLPIAYFLVLDSKEKELVKKAVTKCKNRFC